MDFRGLKRHIGWVVSLIILAAVVFAPLWRGSAEGIPIHSRLQWDSRTNPTRGESTPAALVVAVGGFLWPGRRGAQPRGR